MNFPKVRITAAERNLVPFISLNALFAMKLIRELPTQYLIYANDHESVEFAEIVGHTGMTFHEPILSFYIAKELRDVRQAISQESYRAAVYPRHFGSDSFSIFSARSAQP